MATYFLRDNAYDDGYESPSMLSGSSNSIVDSNNGFTGVTGGLVTPQFRNIFGSNWQKLKSMFSDLKNAGSISDVVTSGFKNGFGGIASILPDSTREKLIEKFGSLWSNLSNAEDLLQSGNIKGAIDTITGSDVDDADNANAENTWEEIANGYYTNAKAVMDYNAEQAQIDRDWQEYMSNTSYTRAMDDLKNAGLNPVLAVNGLNGASSGSSSAASTSPQSANTSMLNVAILGILAKIITKL